MHVALSTSRACEHRAQTPARGIKGHISSWSVAFAKVTGVGRRPTEVERLSVAYRSAHALPWPGSGAMFNVRPNQWTWHLGASGVMISQPMPCQGEGSGTVFNVRPR